MQLTGEKRKLVSNVFVGLGILLVVGAGFSLWWPEYQGEQLRNRLAGSRPAALVVKTGTLDPATPGGSRSLIIPPEASASPALGLTQLPADTATAEPTLAPYPQPDGSVVLAAPPADTPTDTPLPTDTQPATDTPTDMPVATATPVPASPPVRLVIADLNIDTTVEEMNWQTVNTATGAQSEWMIPEYAAGHAVNSANLGEPGNVVISGHNNIYGRVFMSISQAWGGKVQKINADTELSHLLDGRVVTLYAADGRRFDYQITAFYRVLDSGVPLSQRIANAEFIQNTPDPQVTLTTCWPPWNNTHRLIVIAKPVD